MACVYAAWVSIRWAVSLTFTSTVFGFAVADFGAYAAPAIVMG